MKTDSQPFFTGRCLCGTATYRITGAPVVVAQCHCEECRRLSGTGHTVGAMFLAKNVELSGNLGEYKYRSSKNSEVTKCFCKNCGSPILGKNTRTPDHVTIQLGTMDDATDLVVQVVIFSGDKQHWDDILEGTQSFETQPDWKP